MIDEKKLIEELKERNYQLVFSLEEQSLLDKVVRIVKEQPKIENTINFKHFHLLADSTLKSMTKDDLIDYIQMLYHNWRVTDEQLYNVIDCNYKFDKALDKCTSFICKEDCSVKSDRYKPNYYMVCERCEHRKMCSVVIRGNAINLKKELMKDDI